jgi:hypothetical protein
MATVSQSLLLQLPDPCLLEVLCCCADDPCSLFSAARAHSRLHQAAVLAASSISTVLHHQQQLDSVWLYFTKHGQHIGGIQLAGEAERRITLRQLPRQNLQGLSRLHFSELRLQLRPTDGLSGVVGTTAPVKQLKLDRCRLLDGQEGLVAALVLLPELQHLSLVHNDQQGGPMPLPSAALQALRQLTYLELAGGKLQHSDGLQQL